MPDKFENTDPKITQTSTKKTYLEISKSWGSREKQKTVEESINSSNLLSDQDSELGVDLVVGWDSREFSIAQKKTVEGVAKKRGTKKNIWMYVAKRKVQEEICSQLKKQYQ